MFDIYNPQVGMAPILLYLDPGTGGLLFSVIMGAATTAFFLIKGLFYKIRGFFSSARQDAHVKIGNGPAELVVYSEGGQYATTFRPVLKELVQRGISCTYLSSDPTDPLLDFASDLVKSKCIGSGYAAWGQLNNLQAAVCLMTTPGLDVMQIKRSKKVSHYAHLIHSPTDKAFNRPYSFDYFDSVFICGPHQEKTIRFLEILRNTKAKALPVSGCLYYDELVEAYSRFTADSPLSPDDTERSDPEQTRVLVAPTWGKNGLLHRYGMDAVRPLASANFSVVIRPHPQSRISEPELLLTLKDQTRAYPNVIWDESASPIDEMAKCDALVSDISGIVFDYAFVTGKPVLVLDFEVEKRGFEASDLDYEPWELEVLERVGRKIKKSDLEQLANIIQVELGRVERRTDIMALREEYVQYFGASAPRTVDLIEQLLAQCSPEGQRDPSRFSATDLIPAAQKAGQ